MPNELTLEDNDATDPQDAERRIIGISSLIARATIRLGNLAGAVPPGPPHDPPFIAALQSLQQSAGTINEIASGILQRPPNQ